MPGQPFRSCADLPPSQASSLLSLPTVSGEGLPDSSCTLLARGHSQQMKRPRINARKMTISRSLAREAALGEPTQGVRSKARWGCLLKSLKFCPLLGCTSHSSGPTHSFICHQNWSSHKILMWPLECEGVEGYGGRTCRPWLGGHSQLPSTNVPARLDRSLRAA